MRREKSDTRERDGNGFTPRAIYATAFMIERRRNRPMLSAVMMPMLYEVSVRQAGLRPDDAASAGRVTMITRGEEEMSRDARCRDEVYVAGVDERTLMRLVSDAVTFTLTRASNDDCHAPTTTF